MWGIVIGSLVAIVGVAVAIVSINSLRFARRVDREAREMWAATGAAVSIDRARIARLPSPVATYLEKAIRPGRVAVRTVRLRHGGTFRPSLEGGWFPIRGRQFFSADPPGFVWWGRIRIVPGVWVEARDRTVNGIGSMLIVAESTFTIGSSAGLDLDRSALARLLGEMAWFPTAFLDDRYVAWSPVDERHAQATLRVNGKEATAVFEFGVDGLPVAFRANRSFDMGKGTSVMRPFLGEYSDYREVDGLVVPHKMNGAWSVDGVPKPYVRFSVEDISFNPAGSVAR